MANILEFLRGVLTDDESQQLFRSDPEGFVTRAGFDDLTGEDVVEAIVVLRRSLPPEVATTLADFEDERQLPPVRPAFDERELDAALRQLGHAIDLTSGAVQPQDGQQPAEQEAASPEPSGEAAGPQGEGEPVHDELIRMEVELEPEPVNEPEPERQTEQVPEPVAASNAQRPDIQSPQAFGNAISAAATDVRTLLEEYAEEVLERLSSTVEVAERDAASIRGEAEADRENARRVLLDAREEADRIRAEAEADREARRQELRVAEQELKERLAGLEGVFRTIMKED
jgi:hypothetical protein